jgi:hypothetical protein
MMEGGPADIRLHHGRLIDLGFKRRDKTSDHRKIWSWPARRWHQSRPEFTDNFFDALRALFRMRQIDRVPRESTGLEFVVVTACTVLIDKAPLSIDGYTGRAWHTRALCGARSRQERNANNENKENELYLHL